MSVGVDSAPELSGADDTNSIGRPVNPFLRSLDGINTHDLARIRSISGGITTSLVLPGSANSIGGQAFAIKLRQTAAKTPDSMILEMPFNVAGAPERRKGDPPRWRHMKMACGENIRRVYKQTRMDLSNNFRAAFNSAKDLKLKQDDFCAEVMRAHANGDVVEERFPDDLEWEALTDVLRGKVKVNTHCYESTDFAAFVRHSNEFKFPVAAFHHAHEAWIVPDLLKQTYGGAPAVALFATNARYKREAWRGTEYAPKILEENNITVIMKSDHPVLDSRYLTFEAQQAHHFGFSAHKALASVTTSSAEVAGLGHRVGYVRDKFDADIVLWDSHPLSLGSTPTQVWIDGIQQLAHPYSAKPLSTEIKPPPIASVPEDPLTLQDEDDPWTHASARVQTESHDEVVFTNVNEVLIPGSKGGLAALGAELSGSYEVHVLAGEVACIGACLAAASSSAHVVDLKGGSLLPPIVGYGPGLGLVDIISEKSAQDNAVLDPLMSGDLSRTQQLWGPTVAVKAIDGLAFGGKHLLISHSAGVTKAVTAPISKGFFSGVSVAFSTNAENVLAEGAIIDEAVALHVSVGHYKAAQTPSISTEIAELRGLLLGGLAVDVSDGQSSDYFALAAHGKIPLVVNAGKADHLASLIRLKHEIERSPNQTTPLRWVVHGGQEAHLVAAELAEADIAVILDPPRAFPGSWDERRALAGPPLTQYNPATALEKAGVKVGLGVPEEWQARQLLWEAAWAQKDSGGEVDRQTAVGWVSSNLEHILGLSKPHKLAEFVAYEVSLTDTSPLLPSWEDLLMFDPPFSLLARPVRVRVPGSGGLVGQRPARRDPQELETSFQRVPTSDRIADISHETIWRGGMSSGTREREARFDFTRVRNETRRLPQNSSSQPRSLSSPVAYLTKHCAHRSCSFTSYQLAWSIRRAVCGLQCVRGWVPKRGVEECLPLHGLLLLCELDHLALNLHPLPTTDSVHILLGQVLLVGLLAQVLELLLSRGDPERVLVKHLVAVEHELRAGSAAGPGADLVCKPKRLDDWEESGDGEERGALLHLLADDPATALADHAVHLAEDLARGLDVARVHGQLKPGRPVEQALSERL